MSEKNSKIQKMNQRKAKKLYTSPLQRSWLKFTVTWCRVLKRNPDIYPGISRGFVIFGNKMLREL